MTDQRVVPGPGTGLPESLPDDELTAVEKAKAAGSRLAKVGKRLAAKPWIAHLIAAAHRFTDRLGTQFAGAITYFSLLSMVPLLMVAFSIAGFVLYSRPEVLAEIQQNITEAIPGDLSATVNRVIDTAVGARLAVGAIGLVVALYSGVGWMGNVRKAIRAQWRPVWERDEKVEEKFLIKMARDLATLAGLGLAVLLTIALTAAGAGMQEWVLDWLGLQDVGWVRPLVTAGSILVAMAANVLIFFWIYTMIPPKAHRAPRAAVFKGAVIAAVGFELLKIGLTFLLPNVTSTPTGAIFGPIIGLLFFFNLVAQLVLFVAAWISTSEGGPKAPEDELPEIPGPAVMVRDDVGAARTAGLVGVGAIAGWIASRRKR